MTEPGYRRRRPLMWSVTGVDRRTGELFLSPDCSECFALYVTPLFNDAVASVSANRSLPLAEVARRAINVFHDRGHAHYE